MFDTNLKERFANTYKCSNHELILQKGVYPNEYIDDLEKFTETSLPEE